MHTIAAVIAEEEIQVLDLAHHVAQALTSNESGIPSTLFRTLRRTRRGGPTFTA